MRDLVAGVHWALAGSRGEYSAGNGAAMRIAPLAFLLDPATPADRTVIRDVCRITHHHDEAYVGALAVVIAIRFILSGVWSHENSLLVAVAESVPDSAVRDRIKQFLPLTVPPSEVASQFGASGWVVDTVPLALYCAQFIAEQPLSVVLAQAIEVGGDTDTIASITGQIAGTAAGVPPDYAGHFSRITAGDEIIRVAESFADFLSTRPTPS
jgi:ADP-ribosylglycohydrolase